MKKIILFTAILLTLTSCDIAKKIGIGNDGTGDKKPLVTSNTSSVANNTGVKALQPAIDISGEWTIIGVNDKEINQDEDMPYVSFVPSENRFYASNGCNILNGSYTLTGSVISFQQVLATQKMCPDINYDSDINRVFSDERSYTAQLKVQNETTFLYFIDNQGRTAITMSRQNLSWLNGQWDVATINGHTADRTEANIFFDIASLKVHGNTGCNYFNGSLHIDPLEAGSISFSGMGVTRMACPDQDFERAMLVALEQVTAVKHKDNTAILTDADGNVLITLKPAVEKGE